MAVDNQKRNEHGSVPIKLSLQKQTLGCIWPVGQPLYYTGVSLAPWIPLGLVSGGASARNERESVVRRHLQGYGSLATCPKQRLSLHQAACSTQYSPSLGFCDNFLPHLFRPRGGKSKCSIPYGFLTSGPLCCNSPFAKLFFQLPTLVCHCFIWDPD